MDVSEVLIRIGAAWDTYQSGYLSFEEFKRVMFIYNSYIETFAKELNNG